MAGAFQRTAFQNNAFQVDTGAVVATATAVNLTGHWRGPARKKRHEEPYNVHVRRLSELDRPTDKPLFTPDEVIEAPQAELSEEERERVMAAAFDRYAMIADKAVRRRLADQAYAEEYAKALRLRQELDDEDEFILM